MRKALAETPILEIVVHKQHQSMATRCRTVLCLCLRAPHALRHLSLASLPGDGVEVIAIRRVCAEEVVEREAPQAPVTSTSTTSGLFFYLTRQCGLPGARQPADKEQHGGCSVHDSCANLKCRISYQYVISHNYFCINKILKKYCFFPKFPFGSLGHWVTEKEEELIL